MQRFLTIQHASTISGIEVETLIELGRAAQFEMHPLTKIIDPASFGRWRERRHLQEKADMMEIILERHVQILAAVGRLQHRMSSLEDYIRKEGQKEYRLTVL